MATPKKDQLYPIQDEPTDTSMQGTKMSMPPLPTAPGVREDPKFPAYQPDGTSNTSGPAFFGASETAQQRSQRLYADRPASTDYANMSEMERQRRGIYPPISGNARNLDNAIGQLADLPRQLGNIPGKMREGLAPLTGAIGSGIAGAARYLTEEKNPIIARNNARLARAQQNDPMGQYQPGPYALSDEDLAEQQRRLDEGLDLDTGLPLSQTRLDSIRQMQQDRAGGVDPRIANNQLSTGQFGESTFQGEANRDPVPERRDINEVDRELGERRARLEEQARIQRGELPTSPDEPGRPPAGNAEGEEYRRRTEGRAAAEGEEYRRRTEGRAADEDAEYRRRTEARAAGIDPDEQQSQPGASGVTTTEFGTSYYQVEDPNSDQSRRLPASRNPNDNSFTPMDSQELTPNMIGEAAVINPQYREGISNLATVAIDSKMNNPVFQQLKDAESSLDIQRSDFPANRGGDAQFKAAQGQARRRYGELAKRVMRQAPNVFKNQAQKTKTDDRDLEGDTDNVLRMADQIMTESSRDPYGQAVNQEQAIQMAMQRTQQAKQMRSRVRGMLQPGEGGAPVQQQAQQQQQQQAMPSGLIDSSQVPELIQQMEQFDLGYGLSYTNDGMGVITSGNNSFIATSVPNYPVPVAFARSAQEEQLALSLGIPVVSRNNPEVRGGRGLKPARQDAGSRQTRRSGPGRDMYMDDFDPEEQFSKSLENAEKNFDTAYKTFQSYKGSVDQSGAQRTAYHQLARQFRESMGMAVEPGVDYVIRNNLNNDTAQDDTIEQQFAMWLESGMGDSELVERANIKDGQLPQIGDEPDDPLSQRFKQSYDEAKRQMQRATGPSRPGQPEAEPTRARVRQLFLTNEARFLFRENVDQRTQMTQLRDSEFGRDVQRLQRQAYGETTNTGRGLYKTLSRTPNPNFKPQPVATDAEGNVYISSPEEIVNTALVGQVVYEGVPMSIDKNALEYATEELMLRQNQGDERSKVYSTALLEVGQIIRDSFPEGTFPATTQGNRRLMNVSKQMLRRLGYITQEESDYPE